jgi:hypothetical protein
LITHVSRFIKLGVDDRVKVPKKRPRKKKKKGRKKRDEEDEDEEEEDEEGDKEIDEEEQRIMIRDAKLPPPIPTVDVSDLSEQQ